MKKFLLTATLLALSFSMAAAQKKAKYDYAAQKNFIPSALGKVYLGMPFDELAKQIDLSKAETESRFEELTIEIPFAKENVERLVVKVHGLSPAEKKAMLFEEAVTRKDEFGNDYEAPVERLKPDKIPAKGFVYAMYITFKKGFDLKSYALKTYGTGGEVRKPDDQSHFFDIQWTKETSDGLMWLIRSFHEGDSRNLQLLGRIEGTEWGLD